MLAMIKAHNKEWDVTFFIKCHIPFFDYYIGMFWNNFIPFLKKVFSKNFNVICQTKFYPVVVQVAFLGTQFLYPSL